MPNNNTLPPQTQVPQQQSQGPSMEQQLVAYLKHLEDEISSLTQRVDSLEKGGQKDGKLTQQGLMPDILAQLEQQKLIGALQGPSPTAKPSKI